mmetsp:Transcript_7665/g.9686  ORF Transcript_7665/g.9686 Transcript_7665/m.9686 type:complete len:512 (-) Transcript_7665:108-1643(-)
MIGESTSGDVNRVLTRNISTNKSTPVSSPALSFRSSPPENNNDGSQVLGPNLTSTFSYGEAAPGANPPRLSVERNSRTNTPNENANGMTNTDESADGAGSNITLANWPGQSENTVPTNGSLSNIVSKTPSNATNNPPAPTRRSSFGLGFLSSLTNSIRLQHNTASASETPHNFMSNSPTIANLNNYSMSLSEPNQPIISEDVPPNETNVSESSNSDFDHNAELNNLSNLNDEAIDGDRTRVAVNNPSEDQLAEGSNKLTDNGIDKDGCFSVRLTPLIDYSSSASGLYFSPIIRKVKPSNNISIGRYTEKNKSAAHAPQGSSAPIVFKSKVVSRTHALFQCNEDGQWFLKDCKSSSGTFLNHIRLSPASQSLTLMPLIDGDIVQLGMDYRGGTEEVYRCVKMRCEFNKSWQRKVNQFNLEIHQKLKNLAIGSNDNDIAMNPINKALASENLSECAICLLELEPCQALFISPCSHSWHYKCIRPIIIKSYPQFYCPNCRSMCDLETDIEDDGE